MKFVASKSFALLCNINDLASRDFSFLSEREQAVIQERLLGKTLKEIGTILLLSQETIRSTESKAVRRILWRSYRGTLRLAT